jgi:hypothetical protein
MSAAMPVVVLSFKNLRRNSLRGFASIRLGASLKINDVAIHRHESGKCWAALPSKPVLMADGTAKKGDNGKLVYVPMMEWSDKAASDRFSESVIAALEASNPGATE